MSALLAFLTGCFFAAMVVVSLHNGSLLWIVSTCIACGYWIGTAVELLEKDQ